MKLGLIRCRQSEEECGGIHCFKCIENKEGALADIEEELELIGVTTCGGCPGDKLVTRIKMMEEAGADAVVFGSCIKLGTPVNFPCPYLKKLKEKMQQISNIAIIRCLKQEEQCIGQPCLELIKQREKKFADIEQIKLVGMVTCGGCSGKKTSIRAQKLLDSEADKVVLTSCITGGSCRDNPCPYLSAIKDSLVNTVGEDKIIFSTL